MPGRIFPDNDNDVWLINLQRDSDGAYVTDATCTCTVCNNSVTGTVSVATNTTPIIVTSTAHGRTTGDQIAIAQATGNKGANGAWTITVIDANTFSLNSSVGNGTYAGNGKWYLAMTGAVNLSMTYQTNKGYLAVVSHTVNFENGVQYLAVVDAVSASGIGHWETPMFAVTRN